MSPAPAPGTAFECLECIVGWGWDIHLWRDELMRYSATITHIGSRHVIHSDPEPDIGSAIMGAYHEITELLRRSNAPGKNAGTEERVKTE